MKKEPRGVSRFLGFTKFAFVSTLVKFESWFEVNALQNCG